MPQVYCKLAMIARAVKSSGARKCTFPLQGRHLSGEVDVFYVFAEAQRRTGAIAKECFSAREVAFPVFLLPRSCCGWFGSPEPGLLTPATDILLSSTEDCEGAASA